MVSNNDASIALQISSFRLERDHTRRQQLTWTRTTTAAKPGYCNRKRG